VVVAALFLGLFGKLSAQAQNAPSAASSALPALAEFQTNWPRFRGWDGGGVSSQAINGTNLLWRSAIPAPGHGSPVIWGDRVFISGGTAASRQVFCYHAAGGALLWQRAITNVLGSPQTATDVPEDTTYAASTLATDGRRVYAIFGNGDLAAFNFEGVLLWSKYLGPIKNPYGYATSLAVWQTNLFVQMDQGETPSQASKVFSLQGDTGRLLWERNRTAPASWATPIVIEAAGKTQIITLSVPWVIAYAPADGREFWRGQWLEGEVVPSPVFAGGRIFLINPGSDTLLAVRPDGAGDVTSNAIAWSSKEHVPDIPSPVSDGQLAFTVDDGGTAVCFDANDGKKIWEKNLETEVQASPGIAGGRLFILGVGGELVTLAAGREFHEIGRSLMPDKFLASPAFAGGRVFLRGATNLFCLGLSAAPATGNK
jgi:outer membrane protein assembly factor BamB